MAPDTASDPAARLATLDTPVRLVFFTQTFGCDSCLAARRVVDHIASLSDRVSVEEYNLVLDKDQVAAYGVSRAPAIAVVGDTDLGIRYYGAPAGYELSALVEAVVMAGTSEPGLSDANLARLRAVDRPIDVKVFVTPT